MSEINVNLNPRVVLNRLKDNYFDALVTNQQNKEIRENISHASTTVLEKNITVMADKNQTCEPSEEQGPDELNNSKTKMDENESDVTLFNLDVAEIMHMTDECETNNLTSNRNNTNVVVLLINFPNHNQVSVPQQTPIEEIDSKESLAAAISNDSAYLSQSMEVIGI